MPSEGYRLTIEGFSLGYHWQNVLHFLGANNDDTSPIEMAKELVDNVGGGLLTDWQAFNSVSTTIQWISAKRILPSGGNSAWIEYPEASNKGDINKQIESVSISPIVKLYAGLVDGIQGRIFLPPPAEDHIVDNVVTSDYQTKVSAWITPLLSFSDDHDWNLAIYSRKNNTIYPAVAFQLSNIIGQIAGRRKPG